MARESITITAEALARTRVKPGRDAADPELKLTPAQIAMRQAWTRDGHSGPGGFSWRRVLAAEKLHAEELANVMGPPGTQQPELANDWRVRIRVINFGIRLTQRMGSIHLPPMELGDLFPGLLEAQTPAERTSKFQEIADRSVLAVTLVEGFRSQVAPLEDSDDALMLVAADEAMVAMHEFTGLLKSFAGRFTDAPQLIFDSIPKQMGSSEIPAGWKNAVARSHRLATRVAEACDLEIPRNPLPNYLDRYRD